MLEAADQAFTRCLVGGLSSGEGLIAQVRDPLDEQDSEAPTDKRRLVLEQEFAQVLKVLAREANTLSAIVRQAWDGEPLQTIVRNNPLRATPRRTSGSSGTSLAQRGGSPAREAGLQDWGCLEPLDDGVDAERQLPDELRDGRDGLRRAAFVDYVEHHPEPRNADESASDESQYRQASRHEAGPVHQVAKDQPVPDAENEAGTEYERPIANRDERFCVREQRGSGVMAQRHYRKKANDAE